MYSCGGIIWQGTLYKALGKISLFDHSKCNEIPACNFNVNMLFTTL